MRCYVNGTEVAKYRKFDAVGQAALQGAKFRTATLVAEVPSQVFRLNAKDYTEIMQVCFNLKLY